MQISESWITYEHCEFEGQVYGLSTLLQVAIKEKAEVYLIAASLKNLQKNIIKADEVATANQRGTFLSQVAGIFDDVTFPTPKVYGPGDYTEASNTEIFQAQLLAIYLQTGLPNDIPDQAELDGASAALDDVDNAQTEMGGITGSKRRKKREAATECRDLVAQCQQIRGYVEVWSANKAYMTETANSIKAVAADIIATQVSNAKCVEENKVSKWERL